MPTLKRLGSFGLVPDPAELAHDPMRFMDPGDDDGVPRDPVAGVPYRPGLGKNTGQAIVDGVSAKGKWRILRDHLIWAARYSVGHGGDR
ncbi:hypothetical protein ACH46L_31610 [Streptomyces althioticus]|uniref:hypothetical protein n=1 Tax=Streptomyces althioticus TaxID=83380 RepID=UPI00379147A1